MSEFSRGPTARGRSRFYVTNRGSDSEGSDDGHGYHRPQNSNGYTYISHSYSHPRPPLPKPPAQAPSPLTTTNIVSTRVPRYQTSLSSPSSTSSAAAEESTPPPSTPSVSNPPADSPAEEPSVADSPQLSTPRKLMQTIKSPFQKSRPPVASPTKRPSTSPTVSTPDSYTSNSSHSSSSTVSDRTLILVTGDSERYVNVDITGATDAACIRERVFTKLNIFEEEDQAQYSIYQTEIGAFAIGDALSDERLLELCKQHGDARGSLKLLVSHTQAPVHDPPATLSPTSHSLLPPVVLPHYSSAGIQPLQPKRRPRSRHGSLSSASDHHLMEISTGYEADLDNPERDTHRMTIRPQPAVPSIPPPSPHVARRPGSPLGQDSRPGTPSSFPPPPPPPPPPPSSTPIGTETTTIIDQYGRVIPPPPPPPPLSPNRATFLLEDNSLTPPASQSRHLRTGSEAAADHNQTLVPVPVEQTDSKHKHRQPLAKVHDKEMSTERHNRWRNPRNEETVGRSDSWVLVSKSNESSNGAHEGETSSTPQDVARRSPSSSQRHAKLSPARYKSSSPYSIPLGLSIPAAPRNPPPSVPPTSPESRMPSSSRHAGHPVPANWAVSWTGDGNSLHMPSSSSPGWGRLTKGAKSMDNLRGAASHPSTLLPGGGARRGQALPTNRANANFLPGSYNGRDAGLLKSYESRPPIRPLPMHGTSHATASLDSVQQGQYNNRAPLYVGPGVSQQEPYPRPLSAFGDVAGSGSHRYPSRALSPVRPTGNGTFSRPIGNSGHSNPTAERHTSPPHTPTSPRNTSLDGERGNKIDDHPRISDMLSHLDSTSEATIIPPSRTQSQSVEGDSDSDLDESGTSMWKKPPVADTASQRPTLTVEIEGSNGVHAISVPSATSAQQSSLPGSATVVHRPPRSPREPSQNISAPQSKTRLRGSTFTERDSSWAPRPPPEDVYERLEEFFPEHDLDKPVIEASSGGTSPTTAEPPVPPPPPIAMNPDKDKSLGNIRSSGIKGKKSIRIVAEEHKKRIDRTSRADPSSFSANVLRKRSTKLWGSRLEEVTTAHAKSLGNSPEASTEGPTTFKWVRGELIGRGTYGRVYLAMNATTGEMIAVKQVEIPRTASDKNDSRQVTVVQALKLESETLKDLDHPNIVQYLGFEETPTNLSIFLEYVPGGSIGSCLLKHGKFDEEVTKSFTSQILSGLEYLHSKGILHRDLKADNILVEVSGVCKISDFGISKRTTDLGGGAITAMQGTVFWMAPEVVNPQGRGYNFKVDIWSVGCVVLEMWAGMRPWQGDEVVAVMFKLYQSKLPPPVPEDVVLSDLADDFRRKCFAINPEERPSAAELRRHKYLELTPGWAFTGFK